MKKIFILAGLAIASLLSFSSCVESFEQEGLMGGPTIECTLPSDTKAYVDGASIKWNKDDIIYAVSTADKSIKKTYKLETGEKTTNGTFSYSEATGSAFENGTDVYLFTKSSGADFVYVEGDGNWYFEIPGNQTLVGYNSVSESNALPIPMLAEGTIGGKFAFKHMASLVRLKIKNEFSGSLSIKQIKLSSDNHVKMGGRIAVILPLATPMKLYDFNLKEIEANGNVEIKSGETMYFDFIVRPYTCNNFSAIITDSNYDQYVFRKASVDMVQGNLYSFDSKLNNSTKVPAKYKISIDGGAEVDFFPVKGFPSTPSTSIKITSLVDESITSPEWDEIVACVNKLASPVSVDLTDMTVFGTSFKVGFHSTKVTDFYLPKNVTQTEGTSLFTGATYMKLHITKKITKLAWIAFQLGSKVIDSSAGFYVDADHEKLYSEKGVLYSKDGTKLIQFPSFKDSTNIVVKEGVETLDDYAVAQNEVAEAVTFPSTLKSITSTTFAYMRNLHTIFMKAVNPPTNNAPFPTASGKVVIDTGDPATDITSKDAYQNSWAAKLGGWQVVTKAEYVNPTKSAGGTISDLNKDNSYSSQLW